MPESCCPRNGEPCLFVESCNEVNGPVRAAPANVTIGTSIELGPESIMEVGRLLITFVDGLKVDLKPRFANGQFSICPKPILNGSILQDPYFKDRLSEDDLTDGLKNMLEAQVVSAAYYSILARHKRLNPE